MKERPILFSGPMVKAILEGRKTQTRRVVKLNASGRVQLKHRQWHIDDENATLGCPYGQPGDRLWVREAWAKALSGCGVEPLERWEPGKEGPFGVGAIYRATPHSSYEHPKWKPSIHMPRWASRINLEITNIRVEGVQEISGEDAKAEGLESTWSLSSNPSTTYRDYLYHPYEKYINTHNGYTSSRSSFRSLWDSINGTKHPWKNNDWVWVIKFKVIQ